MKKSFDHFDRHFRTRQNTDKEIEKYRQGCLYFFDRARVFCVFTFEHKIKDEQKANSACPWWFLRMQKPVECQMELRERWEQRNQLRHETAQAYANKLKGWVNQMEERYRPTQHDQLVRFTQGLRAEFKKLRLAAQLLEIFLVL